MRLSLGYGDSNLRPVPRLGSPLINPLHRAEASALVEAGAANGVGQAHRQDPRIMTDHPLDLAGIASARST